ncbi:hypothetical protein V496_09536 [Pseudogymnoascus sp. VKM F-4515 (FW-2607)]|nr:hypothetical protein V496_09536 [Pseudogymnoascus sp. VKM F-4515 (FW-2607)]
MSTNDGPQERDFSNNRGAGHAHAEIFEKMYLTPANKVNEGLRLKFANPTPLGLVGFVIALTPLCCALISWRGAGGGDAAEIEPYYLFGGALQLIAGSSSALQLPLHLPITYGTNVEQFHATFGFFPLFMGLLCAFYFICSLRTNVVFATIFFSLVIALGLLNAGHWQIAQGKENIAANIDIAAGATAFISAICGWYLLLSQLLEALDFPIQLPIGDLSGFIQSRSQKMAKKDVSQLV